MVLYLASVLIGGQEQLGKAGQTRMNRRPNWNSEMGLDTLILRWEEKSEPEHG